MPRRLRIQSSRESDRGDRVIEHLQHAPITDRVEDVGIWICPACDTTIRHYEPYPRPDVVYRCHVCHLEFVLESETRMLMLAPLP